MSIYQRADRLPQEKTDDKFLDRFRYFKQKGETFADGLASFSIPTVTGRMDIASVGS